MGLPEATCGCPSVNVGQAETPAEALRTRQRSWQRALAAKPWLRASAPPELLALIDRQPLERDLAQDAAIGAAFEGFQVYGRGPTDRAPRQQAIAQQDGREAPIGPVLRKDGACEWTAKGAGKVGSPLEGIDYERRTVQPWHLGAESTILVTGAVAEGVSAALSAALDTAILNMVALLEIPNASFSLLSPDGRLVMARGYTNLTAVRAEHGTLWCDAVFLTQPDSQFRIASLTKPMTACAVMQQVQRGLYSLEDSAVAQMNSKIQALIPTRVRTSDGVNRFPWSVRVWHLLTHSAGWCERTGTNNVCVQAADPLNEDQDIADEFRSGVLPVSQADVVRFAFEPNQTPASPGDEKSWTDLSSTSWLPTGQQATYDNFSFVLAGRVIQGASRVSYAGQMRQLVFDPLGMTRSQLGFADPAKRAPWEIAYYSRDRSLKTTVIDDSDEEVPLPYGSFNLANSDAAKGLLSTAVDLARFLRGNQLSRVAEGEYGADWLTEASLLRMCTEEWMDRVDGFRYGRFSLGWSLMSATSRWIHGGTTHFVRARNHSGRLRGTAAELWLNPPPSQIEDSLDNPDGTETNWRRGAGFALLCNKDVNAATVPGIAPMLLLATDGRNDLSVALSDVLDDHVGAESDWGTADLMERYP